MEIEDTGWRGERLVARFGDGYRAAATTGSTGGLHNWNIFSGCLPGDDSYGNLIEGLPRWNYYSEFVKEHTVGGRDVFEITFRGKRYHAAFTEDRYDATMFTADLFGEMTLAIEQAKVDGITYDYDGSILEIENIPGLLSWHVADFGWSALDSTWTPKFGEITLLADGEELFIENNAQNGRPVIRLNEGISDAFLVPFAVPVDPTAFEVFIVMQMREATFSNDCGILSTDAAGAVTFLRGDSGTTKFENLSFAELSTYRLNGVEYPQSNQQAPMNEFGVIHLTFDAPGFTLSNLQFGKDKGTAGTFGKVDYAEIIIVGENNLSDALNSRLNLYLKTYWGIS